MLLAEYLKKHKLSTEAFAGKIGTSQSTVSRYSLRKRIPRPRHMALIAEVTEGEVTYADFYSAIPQPRPDVEPTADAGASARDAA